MTQVCRNTQPLGTVQRAVRSGNRIATVIPCLNPYKSPSSFTKGELRYLLFHGVKVRISYLFCIHGTAYSIDCHVFSRPLKNKGVFQLCGSPPLGIYWPQNSGTRDQEEPSRAGAFTSRGLLPARGFQKRQPCVSSRSPLATDPSHHRARSVRGRARPGSYTRANNKPRSLPAVASVHVKQLKS